MFDNVMLMVEGRFIYQGKGGNIVKDYFSKIGFTCGRHENPAGKKEKRLQYLMIFFRLFYKYHACRGSEKCLKLHLLL